MLFNVGSGLWQVVQVELSAIAQERLSNTRPGSPHARGSSTPLAFPTGDRICAVFFCVGSEARDCSKRRLPARAVYILTGVSASAICPSLLLASFGSNLEVREREPRRHSALSFAVLTI